MRRTSSILPQDAAARPSIPARAPEGMYNLHLFFFATSLHFALNSSSTSAPTLIMRTSFPFSSAIGTYLRAAS